MRTAAQAAHNDIELALLRRDWERRGVHVHTLPFVFGGEDAPLSWHLTQQEVRAIGAQWDAMADCRRKVAAFLAGSDALGPECPFC